MPYSSLKDVYMIHKNTQTYSLGGWEEGVTGDGGGKVTQERTTEPDAAKVTSKK